jgi:hypothetical protein
VFVRAHLGLLILLRSSGKICRKMTSFNDPDDGEWTGPVFGLEPSQECFDEVGDTLGEGMVEAPGGR